MAKRMRLDAGILIEIAVAVALLLTLFGFFGVPSDFKGEAEYVNGILAASSVIFGFWAIMIEREPEEETKKSMYKGGLFLLSFIISLVFFVIAVITVYLGALNELPYKFTLWFCMSSLLFNTALLIMTLYYYKFKGR